MALRGAGPVLRRPTGALLDVSWFPPVLTHPWHPTCTAAVLTAMAGYHVRSLTGRMWTPSLLFSYYTSRVLSDTVGQPGSRLDWALAAWRKYGLPAEHDWSFSAELLDTEPPASVYEKARGLSGIGYTRLDSADVLAGIRAAIDAGMPVTAEFPIHPAQASAMSTGFVSMLPAGALALALHVVVVVGYDDELAALRIRNSWGTDWGEDGYGWLPYDYCHAGLTSHHWVVDFG
jgi:hypothetical protein